MLCTKCKIREATTEVIYSHNDMVKKMYLCPECAKEYRPELGINDLDVFNKLMNGAPMDLLSGFNGFLGGHAASHAVCPECKTTSEQFLKTGFVGCPHCYEVFEPLIAQTVKKLQQSDVHVGKTPAGAQAPTVKDDVSRLRAELQNAIDAGDYARVSAISNALSRMDGNGEG